MGMASLSAYERPVYSASVVLIAISLCNWLFHIIGTRLYMMMYPWRDLAVSRLSVSMRSHNPAKSESTKTSKPFESSGSMVRPRLTVFFKYLPNHFTALPCSTFGLSFRVFGVSGTLMCLIRYVHPCAFLEVIKLTNHRSIIETLVKIFRAWVPCQYFR